MAKNAISYIRNVGKSAAYMAIDTIKDMNPVINDFSDTNGDIIKDSYKVIRKFKRIRIKDATNTVMESKSGKFAKKYLDNLTSDIKSGKFYNKERIKRYDDAAANSFMGLDDEFDAGNDSFGFDDGDSFGFDDEPSSNEMIDIVGEKTSTAISNTMARSSEYIVHGITESNRAMYNRMNAIYGGIHSDMSTINQNISKLLEFSSETVVTHFENSRTFYQEITRLDEERNQYLKDILEGVKALNAPAPTQDPKYRKNTYSDIVNYSGVLNIGEYIENIKKNINDKSAGMGDMLKMFSESGVLDTFAASPVSGIMKAVIEKAMPTILQESFENFNKSLSGITGNLLMKLKENASEKGGIWNTISDIFGINTSLKTTIDPSNYEKGKIPFDGVTKKAIIEVIPTYLSKILSALNGKNESRFNYDTGKFVNVDDIQKEFNDLTKNSARRAAFDLDQVVNSKKGSLQWDENQKRQFEQDWEAIKEYMYKNQKSFNTRDKNLTGSSFGLKGGIASDINVRLLQQMLDGSPEMLKYADEMFRERSEQNRRMAQYEANSNSTISALFNGSIDDNTDDKQKTSDKAPSVIANANKTVLSELSAIHKELSYIRMYGTGGGSQSSNIRTNSGIILPDGVRPSFDNFTIPVARAGNDRQYDNNVTNNTSNNNVSNNTNTNIDEQVSNIMRKVNEEQEANDTTTASKSFSQRMNEAAGLSAKMSVLASSATELAKKPAKFIVSVLDKADQRLYDLIYGTKEDKNGDKSFAGKLIKGLENIFNKFSDFVTESIINPLKDKINKENIHNAAVKFFNIFGIDLDSMVSKAKEYLFGKKDENGNRLKNGIFGKFTDDIKNAFTSAKDWIKGTFKDVFNWSGTSSKKNKSGREKEQRNAERDEKINYFEDIVRRASSTATDIPEAASGIKKVNKTGLAVISEGEAIIPPDMNPFNVSKRKRNEKKVKRDLKSGIDSIFEYAEGTDDATSGKKSNDIKDLIKNNKISEEQRKRNNATKARIASNKAKKLRDEKEKFTKEDYEEGRNPFINRVGEEIHNGMKSIFDSVKKAFGINDEENNNDEGNKFKKNVSDYISKFKEYSGTMAAGGIMGAGVSVLTGMIGGPLVGAAVGAGIGLIKKSETVQKMLFGDVDENGDYKGGLIPKNISNNIKKYFGDMSKGATVGGILSLLPFVPGGPISGIILGSAIGFAKNNEKIQNSLFGEGKLLGDKDQFQEKVKRVLPKMGAGALAGLLGGPFGLTTNILLGSALGFATDTNKFKDLIFGKEDEETGERSGGIIEKITKPAVNIFKDISSKVKDYFTNLYSESKEFFKKYFVDPIKSISEPIRRRLEDIGNKFKDSIMTGFKKHVWEPIDQFIKDRFISPIGKLFKNIFSNLLKPVKGLLSLPGRLINRLDTGMRARDVLSGKARYMSAQQSLDFMDSVGEANLLKYGRVKYAKSKIKDQRGFYEKLAGMDSGNLGSLTNELSQIYGVKENTVKFEKEAYDNMYNSFYRENNTGDKDFNKTALRMINKGKFEDAREFITNNTNIDPTVKANLLKSLDENSAKVKQAKAMADNTGNILSGMTRNINEKYGLNFTEKEIQDLASGKNKDAKRKLDLIRKEFEVRTEEDELKEKDKKEKGKAQPTEEDEQKRHKEILDPVEKINENIQKLLDLLNRSKTPEGFVESGMYDEYKLKNPEDDDVAGQSIMPKIHKAGYNTRKIAKATIKEGKLKAGEAVSNIKDIYDKARHSKIGNKILGDDNQRWRNGNVVAASEGEVVVTNDNVSDIPENATGGFGGDKDNKFTIKGFFKDINNSIKKISGNISAMAFKDGIDTSSINENSDSKSYLDKIKNKFKKGTSTVTQFVDGLPLKFKKDKNGDLVEDTGSAENKDTRKKIDEKNSIQKGILAGITGLGSSVTGLFGKLFGDKDEEKESIFSRIWKFLSGGGLGNLISGALGGLSTVFSGALSSALPLALSGLALSGKLDNAAEKITGGALGGKDDNKRTTVKTKDGKRREVKKDENGNIVRDEEGNPVAINGESITDAVENSEETNGSLANMSLSQRLKYNAVRGAITGKGSVIGAVVKSTPVGRLATKGTRGAGQKANSVISKIIKTSTDTATLNSITDSVIDGVTKWSSRLKGASKFIPQLSGIADKLDDIGLKIAEVIEENLPKAGTKLSEVSKLFSKLNIFVALGMAVVDFTTGYQDASTTLKIKEEDLTTGHKIACGLLRSIKNVIPIIGTFIPDQLITDLLIDYVLPLFGYDNTEIKALQDEAQADLDKYNAENGTNYDWSTFNKEINGKYTWTEKLGNGVKNIGSKVVGGAKTIGSKIVNGAKSIGESITGFGSKVVNGVKGVGATIFGSKEEYFVDSAGNQYRNNGNGTYSIISSDGQQLGVITEDALPQNLQSVTEKTDGVIGKATNKVKEFGSNIVEGAKDLGSKAKNFVSDKYNTAKTAVSNAYNGAKDWVGDKVNTAKTAVSSALNAVNNAFNPVRELASYASAVVKDSWNEMISGEEINSDNLAIQEDDPYGDYKKIIYNTIKILGFIPGSIVNLGRSVWEKGIKPFIEGVKTVRSGATETVLSIFSKAWQGDLVGALKDTSGNAETDNNFINSISSVINGTVKVLSSPFALLTAGVGNIVHGFDDFVEGAKTVGSSIKQSVSSMFSKAWNGNAADAIGSIMDKSSDSNTGNGLVDNISKTVNFVTKLFLSPAALLTSGVGNVVRAFNAFVEGAKTVGSSIKDSVSTMFSKAWNGTGIVDVITDKSSDSNTGNALIDNISKTVNFVTKLFLSPAALLTSGVGNIVHGFDSFVEGAKTVGSSIKDTVSNLFSKAWSGNAIEAITDNSNDAETDNSTINSISSVINTITRVLLSPAAFLSAGVGNIVRGFKAFVEGAKTVGSSIKDTVSNIMQKATSGKNPIDDIMSNEYDADTGNELIDNISSMVNTIVKVPLTPVALLTSGVINLKNNIVTFFDDISKAGKLSQKDKDIIEKAKDGEINPLSSDYWKTNTTLSGVAGGLNTFITLMNKVFNLPSALISFINPVNAIKNAGDWILDKLGIDDSETRPAGSGSGISNKRFGRGSGIRSYVGRASDSLNYNDGTFVSQLDDRYKDQTFNISGDTQRQTLGDTGCAPASAAMAINAASGGNVTSMVETSKHALKYKEKNDGVNATYFEDEFSRYGMGTEYITSENKTTRNKSIINNLNNNNKVVLMGQDNSNTSKDNSPFGPNPHYVVASGISKDRKSIYINDPEQNRPNVKYNASKILGNSQIGIAAHNSARGTKYKAISKFNSARGSKFRRSLVGRGKSFNPKLSKFIGRATYGPDTAEYRVWVRLIGAGFSEASTAGVMGNIRYESGFKPNNVENQLEPKIGYNDNTYTSAVDNGQISKEKFMHPLGGKSQYGYGLCQWTYPTRKAGLYDYAKEKGVSIGDLDMQIDFLIGECTPGGGCNGHASYMLGTPNGSWTGEMWKNATDPETAGKAFCYVFERPPASDSTSNARATAAREYYEAFTGTPGVKGSSGPSTTVNNVNTSSTSSSSGGVIGEIYSVFNNLAQAYGITQESNSEMGDTSGGLSSYTEGGGGVSSNASIAEKQKAVVDKATSITGQITYSMSGPRDPEQKSADCSSFVNWAYRKTLGTDIGGYTGAQTSNPNLYTVYEGGGGQSDTPDESKLQLGDLLYYTRDYSTGDPTYPMDIGHVGMYMGNGKEIHHPGPTGAVGPKELPLNQATRFRLAKRHIQFKNDKLTPTTNNLLNLNTETESTDNTTKAKKNAKKNNNEKAKGSGLLRNFVGRASSLQNPSKFKDEANIVSKAQKKLQQQYSLLSKKNGSGSYQITGSDTNNFATQNNKLPDVEINNLETIKNVKETNKTNKYNNKKSYSNISGRASKTTSTPSYDSIVLVQLVKAILQMIGKIVTNTDQLNNITKLLGEYMVAQSKSDGSEQSKQNTALVKQNLITALQGNNSKEPNQDILRLIQATEKIARE